MRDMSLDHQEAAEVTNEDTMSAQVTPQKRKKMASQSLQGQRHQPPHIPSQVRQP